MTKLLLLSTKTALYVGMLFQAAVCVIILGCGVFLSNVPILTDVQRGGSLPWPLIPFLVVFVSTCLLLLYLDLAFSPPVFRRRCLVASAALNASISCIMFMLCSAALTEPKHIALSVFFALLNVALLGVVSISSWHTALFRKSALKNTSRE